MRRFSLTIVLVFVLLPATVSGNPVKAEVAAEYRELVERTAREGVCPDAERLVHFFRRFGLDLLDAGHRAGMISRFDVFAPLLVESQKPGRPLHVEVLEFYGRYASGDSRESMARVLRAWLRVPIEELDQVGYMIDWTIPEEERRAIQRERAKAAEVLVEWGDPESASLIDGWLRSPDLDPEVRPFFERARGRVGDPCHGLVLRSDEEGRVFVCIDAHDLSVARVRTRGEERPLNREEIDTLCGLLPGSSAGVNSGWAAGPKRIEFQTRDGITGWISPTEEGRVTYRDRARLDQNWRLTLENPELHDFLDGLEP